MHLLDEVRRFLRTRSLTDCRMDAALSGGADSICLLHVLYSLREELSLDLHAIHIQHCLRGEESLRDEQFCRDFCEKLGIPLTVVTCHVQEYAQEHRLSIETAARECRYAAFAEHCGELVATAHTASDQLETVLMRLARGTGLKGLCGIPDRRDRFIRPLLHVTRSQVEAYVRSQGLSYVSDSTNAQDAYRRNYLRHHAVPALLACNPSAEEACAAMTEDLRLEEAFLAEQTELCYAKCRQPDGSLTGLDLLHPAMQRRCIAKLLESRGLSSRQNILIVCRLLETGGSAELEYAGTAAHVSRGVLWLEKPLQKIPCKPLQLGENFIYEGILVEAEVIPRTEAEKFARIHTMFANSVLDYDIIKRNAVLHGRQPSLSLKTAGREHRISIKKWLNAEVPPAQRSRVHYLSDADGLLWVQGLGAAEHAAVTENTRNMLFLRIITE